MQYIERFLFSSCNNFRGLGYKRMWLLNSFLLYKISTKIFKIKLKLSSVGNQCMTNIVKITTERNRFHRCLMFRINKI